MKWRGRRGSGNIRDIRRGGGGRRVRRAGGGLGLVGVLAVLAGMYFGVDITPFLGLLGQGGGQVAEAPQGPNTIDDEAEAFISVVLADTEEVWTREFADRGARYRVPILVLFSGAVRSACGQASSAVGPFYCPGDNQIYLDTDFFRVLESQLGAKGDFAQAYVIAHEVAHHVQNLMGVMRKSHEMKQQVSQIEANKITVRVELQADCLSGVWANRADRMFGVLERGDIEEALDTAARIGDDALQRRAQGQVVPDSFTHGTSKQRQRWFYRGFETGKLESCDTFAAARL